MRSWFRSPPESPVPDLQRLWIESRFQWLTDQFTAARLADWPLILPTTDFFADSYDGGEEEIYELMVRVAKYMSVDPSHLQLKFYDDTCPPLNRMWTAELCAESDGPYEVWLEVSGLDEPLGVVAALAHEIGHVLLIGQERISPDERDHESLADLLTVFMGLGIFTANSALHETSWSNGQFYGYSIRRKGFITMDMFGYAFALYALARDEPSPEWAAHLRPDVRGALKRALRFIQETENCTYRFLK